MIRRFSASLVLAGFALSCRQPATQLVVLVDTDYEVPAQLSDLRVRIEDPDGVEIGLSDLSLNGRGESQPPRFGVPLSFGIVPVGGDATRRVRITVTGLAPGGLELVSRRARTGFLANRSLLLPMFLLRSCEGVVCGPEMTCERGGCVPDEVDPLVLRPIDPGGERDAGLRLDAGPESMDAGLEAGPDASPDASPDAGRDASVDAAVDSSAPDSAPDAGSSEPRFVRHLQSITTCGSGRTDITLAAPVPVGDTLVLGAVWRNSNATTATATDSQGNLYEIAQRGPMSNPSGCTLTAGIETRLAAGDVITVIHPNTEAIGVTLDQLTGVAAHPLAVLGANSIGRTISESISAPVPGLLYGVVGNQNNRTFTQDTSWRVGTDAPVSCPVSFGTLDVRTYYLSGGAGAHMFSGSYPMPQSWILTLLAFGPGP